MSEILIESVTPGRLEAAVAWARQQARESNWSRVDIARRAVLDRAPRMMQALEKGAETMHKMNEHQYGEMQRQSSRDANERAVPTEVAMWRESFRIAADKGTFPEQFAWIYVAAGKLAGLYG